MTESGRQNAQNALEGKTFIIQVYDYSPDGKKTGKPMQDELTFVGGKLSSKVMSKEHIFAPGSYWVYAELHKEVLKNHSSGEWNDG